jgi:hypothetical protein
MRLWAHLAIALGLAAADGAAAQSLAPDATRKVLNQAAFAPTSAAVAVDPSAKFVERDAYAIGEGAVSWQSGEVRLSDGGDGGPVDSLRINIGSVLHTPGGLPLNLERGSLENDHFDVTLVRSWPGAVSFSSDKLAFEIAPHAGFGVSNFGTQAEGGATLTVSKSRGEQALERLRDMGVKDGASFGDRGRWYLFAAASGRAVGLNMLRGENGWDRAGWSTDASGALVGDAQVGVGWRKGDVQSSFGVIHREVKGRHMIWGQQTRDDTVAAFTFSLRPQR